MLHPVGPCVGRVHAIRPDLARDRRRDFDIQRPVPHRDGPSGRVNRLQTRPYREMQKRLAHAICLSALALGAAHPLVTEAASKSIAVSAFVTANAVVQVEYQAQQLVVTAADVARGYCDAPAASRLRVPVRL